MTTPTADNQMGIEECNLGFEFPYVSNCYYFETWVGVSYSAYYGVPVSPISFFESD
jgi:hypothetical protein